MMKLTLPPAVFSNFAHTSCLLTLAYVMAFHSSCHEVTNRKKQWFLLFSISFFHSLPWWSRACWLQQISKWTHTRHDHSSLLPSTPFLRPDTIISTTLTLNHFTGKLNWFTNNWAFSHLLEHLFWIQHQPEPTNIPCVLFWLLTWRKFLHSEINIQNWELLTETLKLTIAITVKELSLFTAAATRRSQHLEFLFLNAQRKAVWSSCRKNLTMRTLKIPSENAKNQM